MKKCFVLIVFLLTCQSVFSQSVETVVNPGTELLYRIDANNKFYDFVATIVTLKPLSFTWQIVDSARAKGAIQHAPKALRKGNIIYTSFVAGETLLGTKTTSLFLSQKSLKHFNNKVDKPLSMQLGSGGERSGMGTYTGDNDYTIKINGTNTVVKEKLVKPLVKLGKEYIPTGEEMFTYYNSETFPIILRMRTSYSMELISITNK